MITLKQIEALHWIAELGTFERAALKLNTTQSAISKRILELEAACSLSVFDRSQRGARLTERGAHLLSIGRDMLEMRDRITGLRDAADLPTRQFRFGVTELTALTWLPRLVNELRTTYPGVELMPEVDLSRTLFERLLDDTVDLIVIPETLSDVHLSSLRLTEVHNSWMASPDLIRSSRALSLNELGAFTILSQGQSSGSGIYFDRWLKAEGAMFTRVLSSNSLVALVGLTLAGIGVSYLPRQCFQPLVDTGNLAIIPTTPVLPPVPYAAMYRNDRQSRFPATVATLIQTLCDFSRQYQR